MKTTVFASRNTKEILRDPLTVFFGIAFPIILLVLLWAIGRNIPPEAGNDSFTLIKLTPGLCVFGMSFVTLFSAMLVSKDRSESLMLRLMTSPMKPTDFIIGYTLPLLPMALIQAAAVIAFSLILGLGFSVNLLMVIVVIIPSSVFFIALGLFFGTILTEKQTGGICGALITNLTAWLSGIWFPVAAVGKGFETFANLLPFVHSVDAARAAASGNFSEIMPHLIIVIGYAVVMMAVAVLVFRSKMVGKKI